MIDARTPERTPVTRKRATFRAPLLALILVSAAAALSGCFTRPIRADDPLADRLDARRYLGIPLSCIDSGIPNVLGPPPVLRAGSPVRVVSILTHRGEYIVRFTGPEECAPHCSLRLQADGSGARFDAVFPAANPLAGLAEDVRARVLRHEVAAGMAPDSIRLALGEPDHVEPARYLGSPAERWVYLARSRDERGEWIETPRLVVVIVAGKALDYEDL